MVVRSPLLGIFVVRDIIEMSMRTEVVPFGPVGGLPEIRRGIGILGLIGLL